MSSNRSVPPILIRPKPSVFFAFVISGLHLSALAVLAVLSMSAWIKIGLFGAVGLGLAYILRIHSFQVGSKAIREFIWLSENTMRIVDGRGQSLTVELCKDSFIYYWLMILNLCGPQGEHRTLLLFADSADSESLRRLRMRLLLTAKFH